MSTLIGLAILALIVWLAFFILGQMGLPEVPRRIVAAVLGVIFLIWLLGYIGPAPEFCRIGWR